MRTVSSTMTSGTDERRWMMWSSPRDRVRAWALTDDAPRSATGIALSTNVRVDRTRQILANLVAEGVVTRAERHGVVRFGPDRERMQSEAEEVLADADGDEEKLRDRRDTLVQRLHDTNDPVVERLAVYWLRVLDIALRNAESGKWA
ncbi:DUF7342 family protein [Natronomonas salsuginis]